MRIQEEKLKGKKKILEESPLRNIITRAIGAASTLKVDTFIEPIEDNQLLMLCSDGLHGELSKDEIEEAFHQEEDTSNMVKKLIEMANQKGGSDNITVIIAKIAKDIVEEKEKIKKEIKDQVVPRKKPIKGLRIRIKIPKIFTKNKGND